MHWKYSLIRLKNLYRTISEDEYERILDTFAENLTGFSVDAYHIITKRREEICYRELRLLWKLVWTLQHNDRFTYLELGNFHALTVPVLDILHPILRNVTVLELVLKHCDTNLITSEIPRRSTNIPVASLSRLRRLKLIRNDLLRIFSTFNHLPPILPQVEELELQQTLWDELAGTHPNYGNMALQLTQIPSLRSVTISLAFAAVAPYLTNFGRNLPNLTDPTLNYGYCTPDMITEFKHLSRLKRLELYSVGRLKKRHLVPIMRHLPKLENFSANVRIARYQTQFHVFMRSKHVFTRAKLETLNEIVTKQEKGDNLHITIFNKGAKTTSQEEQQLLSELRSTSCFKITRTP